MTIVTFDLMVSMHPLQGRYGGVTSRCIPLSGGWSAQAKPKPDRGLCGPIRLWSLTLRSGHRMAHQQSLAALLRKYIFANDLSLAHLGNSRKQESKHWRVADLTRASSRVIFQHGGGLLEASNKWESVWLRFLVDPPAVPQGPPSYRHRASNMMLGPVPQLSRARIGCGPVASYSLGCVGKEKAQGRT